MAQLRGEELLRFTQACRRTPKNQPEVSAYEILARSGYERRREKDIGKYSIKTYAVENFINNYCKALIEKHGIPERLEQPMGPHPNQEFADEATLPQSLLEAVQKLKVSMKAFKTGYMHSKGDKITFDYEGYSRACENAKKIRKEEAMQQAEDKKREEAERARKAIKDEIDLRAQQYRRKGVKTLPRISGTQPSPKAQDTEKEVLTGKQLILHCIRLANQGVPETSICIKAGYKTDSIGVFRRAFSKAAAAKFGPLSLMLRDFAKNNENASKIIAELDEPRSISIDKKSEELPQPKATQEPQATTQDRNLVTVTTKQRERDAAFRDAILKIHGEQCVCCDIAIKELLEAAHIVPVAFSGSDSIVNGLPLCPTHHSAFDRNLFTFDPVKKTILLKEGITAADLGITKNFLEANVSQEALRIRLRLFSQA